MPKQRRQDAWLATVQIAIPIDASDPATASWAKAAVEKVCSQLPGKVTITRATFGKMDVEPVPTQPLCPLAEQPVPMAGVVIGGVGQYRGRRG